MRTNVVLLAAAVVVLLAGGMTAQAGLISGTLGDSGWQVYGASSGSVGIAVDREGTDADGRRFVAIEIIKVFTEGPDPQTGSIPPITLNFLAMPRSAAPTATRIYIADEIITNLTGVDWTDFHWIIGTTDRTRFNRELTNPTTDPNADGWHIGPFTNAEWSKNANLGTETLSVAGGSVPNQSSFFPGTGHGNLVIDVDLEGSGTTVFTLKEIPTIPEPASLTLLGLGGAMVILRRRARRS
jgi:hypothetical protein